jgi:hypothetical protein
LTQKIHNVSKACKLTGYFPWQLFEIVRNL